MAFLIHETLIVSRPNAELCTIIFVRHTIWRAFRLVLSSQRRKRRLISIPRDFHVMNEHIKYVKLKDNIFFLIRQPSFPEDLRKYSISMQTMTDCICLSKTIFKRLQTKFTIMKTGLFRNYTFSLSTSKLLWITCVSLSIGYS